MSPADRIEKLECWNLGMRLAKDASAFELATLLRLSNELGFVSETEHAELSGEIECLIAKLTALAKYLRATRTPYR